MHLFFVCFVLLIEKTRFDEAINMTQSGGESEMGAAERTENVPA